MVGIPNNYLLDQMNILLELYNQSEYKVDELDSRIKECALGIDPPCLPLPGIAELSIAVTLSELRSFSKFQSPSKVLSFAGLELGYLQSGQSGFTGCMVKHGSPQPSPSHPRQKNARRMHGARCGSASVPQVLLHQLLEQLVPIQLADQGAGVVVVGDIGGIL